MALGSGATVGTEQAKATKIWQSLCKKTTKKYPRKASAAPD